MSKLADAFSQLVAVVRPRPDMDENGAVAASRRLFSVLNEYDEQVALAALDEWPRHSEWFPTERELRDVLGRMAMSMNRHGDAVTEKGRHHKPVGRTEYFWKRVAASKGEAYAQSWLWGGVTAEFNDRYVFVNQVGHDRLWRDCEDIIRECGVAIVVDNDVAQLLVEYMKDKGIGQYEPKRRRA